MKSWFGFTICEQKVGIQMVLEDVIHHSRIITSSSRSSVLVESQIEVSGGNRGNFVQKSDLLVPLAAGA